jgi:hypothetical protein
MIPEATVKSRGGTRPRKKGTSERERWERAVQEKRLAANHWVACEMEKFRRQKAAELRRKEKELRAGILGKWNYVKKGEDGKPTEPPDVEIGWIIHTQLAWKGREVEEEELWEDLPETDPTEIVTLCEEAKEAEDLGLDADGVIESVVPDEKVRVFGKVLEEMASQGIDIRKETFSLNWVRAGKRHKRTGGRIEEIKSRDKTSKEALLAEEQAKTRLVKPGKEKVKVTKKKIKAKKSWGMLSSFFGLF